MIGTNLSDTLCKIIVLSLVSLLIGACESTTQISGAEAFENIPIGESEKIEKIAGQTIEMQDKRAKLPQQMGQLLRGVHPKSHGCVSAEFMINPDIGREYQIGLFSNPGKKYKAQIRFSNASVKMAHDLEDGRNGSRGMAIKVLDVPGEFLDPDDGRQNQDFLMINTPEFAFADVRGYGFLTDSLHASEHGNDASKHLGLVVILATANQTLPPFPEPKQEDLDKLQAILVSQNRQLPEDFDLQDFKQLTTTMNIVVTKIQSNTVRNPLQVQYFGAAPFLFGPDKVMKFSAAPAVFVEQPKFDLQPNENYLSEALDETMMSGRDISFNFKVQIRDNQGEFGAEQELIENASTTWDTANTQEIDAYVNVAKITIVARQRTNTDAAKAQCEDLVFSPWHSLTAHQPVGGINRLRQSVYFESAGHRREN